MPVGPHFVFHVGATLRSFARAVAFAMRSSCAASRASASAFSAASRSRAGPKDSPYDASQVFLIDAQP